MTDPLGSLTIVLHGHLPYVLHHGVAPHGEQWLFEAAAETYLPLLEVLDTVQAAGRRANLTLGLTPVLLEQLAHPRFVSAFPQYLAERRAAALADAAAFESDAQAALAALARRWADWYAARGEQFARLGGDLPGAFRRLLAAEQIEVLTSNATHCYMPLVLSDAALAAQMRCGTSVSAKHFGSRPRGMWLPECAYRPTWDDWHPSVLGGAARPRRGLETFMAEVGVTHFFVETRLVTDAQVMGSLDAGQYRVGTDDLALWDTGRGWREPLEGVGVVSTHRAPEVFAFARHPRVSEQVWSGVVGYPADGAYLDFHRKHGASGLRYHRVVDPRTPPDQKQPYRPGEVEGRLHDHATHFLGVVKQTLRDYRDRTGRSGGVVASFDAELFGHWWFEGPRFLQNVLLAADPELDLLTAEQSLVLRPPDKVMRLPEGSWGEGGDHRVWMNDRTRLYWEIEYRAERQLLDALGTLPWRKQPEVRGLLTRAARELLLLQASDWAFVIHSGGAVDYGTERIALHAVRLRRLCAAAADVAAGRALTDVQQTEVAEADAHDSIFADVDLNWWVEESGEE